ncbi:MAG: histone deacetylase family protein, partial [Candidatus Xenobia bacterium]
TRAASVLVHEVGHLWGLQHCADRFCVMHQADSLADVDRRGLMLCHACRSKRRPPASPPALPPPPAFVYSRDYRQDFGPHPFPIEKYHTLRDRLTVDVLEPEMPDNATLALVHDAEYLDDLTQYRVTDRTRYAEAPVWDKVILPQRLMVGGTILAAQIALAGCGFCMNMGGGFHHAFAGMGHGFCFYNDVAVAIRKLQHEGAIRKAAIIDCDVHQGNGTAHIFAGDETVFTLSLHQENLFPHKQESTLDVGLPDHAEDELYIARLRRTVPSTLSFFEPDIVFYLAGADPYVGDRLGGLALSMDGLRIRDELVLEQCFSRRLPVCVTLAGGYAHDWYDTVKIHEHTCQVAHQLYGQRSPSASRNCS